jgi:tetratricopeptide (TPR) repeat protein
VARLYPLALLLVAGTAFAQSKRYPAPPKDLDQEADNHSHLWESALDPERKPYEELVRDARRLLDDSAHPQKDQATAALPKLDEAVTRLPKDYRAHALRGRAYLILGQWAKCAEDLELADTPELGDSADRDTAELQLGICQARAGKLADAERTLLHAVAVAPHGEQWMRLGEVRIALGKLDEAVDSLTAALEAHDGVEATIHWLLALAYDRARKSSSADDEARIALNRDPTFSLIQNPAYPWLHPGELEYMMGIARRTSANQDRDATPEIALLYFRRFLRIAGDSPWKRRAEEHVKELAALPFPLALPRTAQSTALVDTNAYIPIVQKAMPALRACVAKLPGEAFTITVVRSGPHETGAAKPHYAVPAASVKITPSVELEPIAQDAEDAAVRCLTPLAERIALPQPKERDTYYQVYFSVVAP